MAGVELRTASGGAMVLGDGLVPSGRGRRHVNGHLLKAHPAGPLALAEYLAREITGASVELWMADMRASPEIYYADHVSLCRSQGVLPLSEVAWRRSCLGR